MHSSPSGPLSGSVPAEAPLAALSPLVDDDTRDTLPPEPLSTREVKRVRVLVVEPAPVISHFILRALVVHGYEVMCVPLLREVAGALQWFEPDLVVSELNLADGSGEAVCELARAQLGNDVSVVLMSTGPEPELVRRATQCNAHAYFSKMRGLNVLLPMIHALALDHADA